MTIPLESLEVGKCYLANAGRTWRIMQIMPNGRVRYEQRPVRAGHKTWKPGMLASLTAETQIEREVLCDWTLEGNQEQGMT